MFIKKVRACTFKIFEIVCVVDDTSAIRVFIINPDFQGISPIQGLLNIVTCIAITCPRCNRRQQPGEWSKKFVQQGRSLFSARSVLSVREHDKMARTPLVAFFNISTHLKCNEGKTGRSDTVVPVSFMVSSNS